MLCSSNKIVADPLREEKKRDTPEVLGVDFRTKKIDVISAIFSCLVDVGNYNEQGPENILNIKETQMRM